MTVLGESLLEAIHSSVADVEAVGAIPARAPSSRSVKRREVRNDPEWRIGPVVRCFWMSLRCVA